MSGLPIKKDYKSVYLWKGMFSFLTHAMDSLLFSSVADPDPDPLDPYFFRVRRGSDSSASACCKAGQFESRLGTPEEALSTERKQ